MRCPAMETILKHVNYMLFYCIKTNPLYAANKRTDFKSWKFGCMRDSISDL